MSISEALYWRDLRSPEPAIEPPAEPETEPEDDEIVRCDMCARYEDECPIRLLYGDYIANVCADYKEDIER